MNDFTKKELGYMADGLTLIVEKCNMTLTLETDIQHLLVKLSTMIENYCDHEKKSCLSCGCYSCTEGCDE